MNTDDAGSIRSSTDYRVSASDVTHEGDTRSLKKREKYYLYVRRRVRKELSKFTKECRQLGRSYPLIVAAKDLFESLDNMLLRLHKNIVALAGCSSCDTQQLKSTLAKTLENCCKDFMEVADAFNTFLQHLSELPGFANESSKLEAAIVHCEEWLRTSCRSLENYKRNSLIGCGYDHENMRHFISAVGLKLGRGIEEMASEMNFFNIYAIPALQYEQKREIKSVLNLLTVATVLSAVTATTLQTSLGYNSSSGNAALDEANGFWFTALVLSMGATLNSLLHVSWKYSTYGFRGRRIPRVFQLWIKASSPVLLAISVVCFSVGLVLFAYATVPGKATTVESVITHTPRWTPPAYGLS